jgi:hypothetical protein
MKNIHITCVDNKQEQRVFLLDFKKLIYCIYVKFLLQGLYASIMFQLPPSSVCLFYLWNPLGKIICNDVKWRLLSRRPLMWFQKPFMEITLHEYISSSYFILNREKQLPIDRIIPVQKHINRYIRHCRWIRKSTKRCCSGMDSIGTLRNWTQKERVKRNNCIGSPDVRRVAASPWWCGSNLQGRYAVSQCVL